MKSSAIAQATARLEKARAALSVMGKTKSQERFVEVWSDFLLAAGGVYSKLESGAKGCGKSEAWFGRRKHERRSDPLLCYIHHARNVDEHGLGATTGQQQHLAITGDGWIRQMVITTTPEGTNVMMDKEGDFDFHHIVSPVLVDVHDERFGDTFPVPRQHQGKQLNNQSPTAIARLTIQHLEDMINDAAKLPKHG